MSVIQDLFREVLKTGPSNAKRILQVIEGLPSEEALLQLNSTLSSLIPYIPQLERILGDGNIERLERMVSQVPDTATLIRLADALPMLEKMPDKETLNRLLDKADSLKGFLEDLEGDKG